MSRNGKMAISVRVRVKDGGGGGVQVGFQTSPVIIVSPLHVDLMIRARQQTKLTCECRMRVAEANQIEKNGDDGARDLGVDLPPRVVVTVDIAAHAGTAQQVPIIRARQ